RELFEDGAPRVAERAVVAATDDPDGVDDDIRLFELASEFREGVARAVVLTVRDEQDGLLRVRAARHLVDAEVDGVVERRLPVRLDEGQLLKERVAVARLAEEELRAVVEADEEVLVARVADRKSTRLNSSH